MLGCNLLGDREGLPVELLEEVLLADQAHLFAVGVIREGRNDVRTGMNEISVQLRHDLGMVEDGLGHERARLHVAAPLELEEIPLGADHRASLEPFAQTAVVWGSRSHRESRLSRAQRRADKASDRFEVRRKSSALRREGNTLANELEGAPGTDAEGWW